MSENLILVNGEWVPKKSYGREMLGNVPGSAGRALVNTAKGVANLPGLGIDILTEAGSGDMTTLKALLGGIKEHYGERYNSPGQAADTLREDPVGAVLDIPILPGGAGVRGAGAASKLLKKGATSMYERGGKFGTTIPQAERNAAFETGLRERLYPTDSGVEKADKLVTKLSGDADQQVARATMQGHRIPADAVLSPLKQLRAEMGGMKVEGKQDLAIINAMEKRMRSHLKDVGRDWFTPTELQEFKKDIYKRINFDRRSDNPMAREETLKAIGRGAREELGKVSPGLHALNERLGQIMELQVPLEKAANRQGNRNLLGMGTIPGAMAGAMLDPIFGTATGALIGSGLTSPAMGRTMTRGMNKASETLGGPAGRKFGGMFSEAFAMPGRVKDWEDEEEEN